MIRANPSRKGERRRVLLLARGGDTLRALAKIQGAILPSAIIRMIGGFETLQSMREKGAVAQSIHRGLQMIGGLLAVPLLEATTMIGGPERTHGAILLSQKGGEMRAETIPTAIDHGLDHPLVQ